MPLSKYVCYNVNILKHLEISIYIINILSSRVESKEITLKMTMNDHLIFKCSEKTRILLTEIRSFQRLCLSISPDTRNSTVMVFWND